jgi:hypothetical protein
MMAMLLLLLAGLFAGCVGTLETCADCDPNDPNVDADYVLVDLQFNNGRLEPPGLQVSQCTPAHRSATAGGEKADWYWLAEEDPLCVYWDKLAMVLAPPAKPDVTASCDLCQSCPPQTLSDGSTFPGISLPGGDRPSTVAPQVRIYASTLPNTDQQEKVAAFGWRVGCENNTGLPVPLFQPGPDDGSLYLSLEAWPSGSPDDPKGHHLVADQASVHAIKKTNDGFPMPLRLLEPVQPFDPARPNYHWMVRELNGRFEEDFSPNLEITKVRVLKGTLVAETGMDAVGKPVSFRLLDAVPVVPFRINLKATDTILNQECLGRLDSADGDINLKECRQSSAGNLVIRQFRATPRFAVTGSDGNPLMEETLDWVVSFRTRAGFEIPVLGPGERFAIEFTLMVR